MSLEDSSVQVVRSPPLTNILPHLRGPLVWPMQGELGLFAVGCHLAAKVQSLMGVRALGVLGVEGRLLVRRVSPVACREGARFGRAAVKVSMF